MNTQNTYVEASKGEIMSILKLFSYKAPCQYAPVVEYSNNGNLPINHLYYLVNPDPFNFNVGLYTGVVFRANGDFIDLNDPHC